MSTWANSFLNMHKGEVESFSNDEVIKEFRPISDIVINKESFHDERSPSLHVYPDGFFCFGCGTGGTSIDFVAKLQAITPSGQGNNKAL